MPRQKKQRTGRNTARRKMLSYGRQWIDESDIRAVSKILRSDFLTQGPTVAEFEEAFAKKIGRRYAVAFANGTAALHAAYFAIGLTAGREIITSPMTFASTANAALFLGAGVAFADVDPQTGLIDPEEILKRISARTCAIMPVHYAGSPADMKAVGRIAAQKKLFVVEDASHALGATLHGRQAGTFGDLAAFSFHPVKPITTGEGGMVVTDDKKFRDRLALFRTHGIARNPKTTKKVGAWFYEMQELGFNYRLTDIQSALGLSQLKRYDKMLTRRRKIAAFYDERLKGIDGIGICKVPVGAESSYHLYPILIDPNRFRGGRRAFFEALHAERIGVQVHYIPVNAHPYYQKLGYAVSDTPEARRFYEREISIPIFPAMTNGDVRDVVRAILKTAGALKR